MAKENKNLMDVTRLFTLKAYSKKFNIPYATLYSRCNMPKSRSRVETIQVNGTDLIYVSPEEEKELLRKMKG